MTTTRQFSRAGRTVQLPNDDWSGRLQQRKQEIPEYDVLPTLTVVRELIGILDIRMPGIQNLFERQPTFELSIRPPEMLTLIIRATPVPSKQYQELLNALRYIAVGLYSIRDGEARVIDEVVMADNGYPVLYRDRQGLEWPVVRTIGKLLFDTVPSNKFEVYQEAAALAQKVGESYTAEAANGQGISGRSIVYWINHCGRKR